MIGEVKNIPENKPTPEDLEKLRATQKVHPVDEVKKGQPEKPVKDRKEEGKGERIDIQA